MKLIKYTLNLLFLLPHALAFGALSLQGTVVDGKSEPVAQALVWLVQEGITKRATTGKSGAYAFEDLQTGHAQLIAWKDGYSVGGHSGPLFQDATVQVVLAPPATIPLQIISGNFFPVAGATIQTLLVNDSFTVPVEDLVAEGFPPMRSDDNGMLDLTFVPQGGFVKLAVGHPDFATSTVAYLPVRSERQELVLVPGQKLRGRVLNQGGSVEGARVYAFKPTGTGADEFAYTRTDPEGYFSVRLKPEEYRLVARHPEYASPAPVQVVVGEESEPVVELTLVEPRFLKGQIVSEANEGVMAVQVAFRAQDGIYVETLTDQTGRFQLKVPTDEGVIAVTPPPGMMTEALPTIPVKMEGLSSITITPVRLQRLPEVSGTILDDKGKPMENVLVVTQDYLLPLRAVTDAQGRFTIPLSSMPEDKEAGFVAEHALRFLRKEFSVDLAKPREVEVKLAGFSPNIAVTPELEHTREEKAVLERLAPDLEGPAVPQADKEMAALVDEPAPAVEGSDWFNSEPIDLAQLKGKVVVLHFWAGFDDSIPGLKRLFEVRALHTLLHDVDDVAFIGIHDASSDPDEVKEFTQYYGLSFPVVRDADPYKTFTSYGIVYIPQTMLIDKEGKLRYFDTEGRLLELIKALRR